MQQNNLKFQKEQVKCFMDSVVILGHLITRKRISSDPKKVEKLRTLKIPESAFEMKSFIGCLTYQKGVVKNLAEYKAGLENIVHKKPYTITDEAKEWFNQAKKALLSSCVNHFYNGKNKLILDCDASDIFMGFILYSLTEGREIIIALNSRKFTSYELKLANQVKECLEIYYAIKKFHQFLTGRRFNIRSDHRTLSLIFKEEAGIKKSTRQIGLVDTIFRADYKELKEIISNRKEELMKDPTEIYKLTTFFDVQQLVSKSVMFSEKELNKASVEDQEYMQLLKHLKYNAPCPKEYKKVEEFLGLENDYALMGERRIILLGIRKKCLELLHLTHDGANNVATIFNQYIVVCQDVFSDIAFLENFERHSINEITEFLMNIIKNYGFPDELVSDGGKELVQFGKL
ncbi:Hypothetical protein SRAE_0000072600 [Strongyloides ratti]|uniref:RT_RNaseH_2 domain-containing protein n=1 Tax=Strongyloides ratti TaxID=34506 RepID=A0A090L2B2_STRRB|nr:Hypothetical protein SRAE_0000072600 [Strongyloides ratti]CEF61609.1 Hypothetical protein SRAE_0000072600 [Strongyloides ratti]